MSSRTARAAWTVAVLSFLFWVIVWIIILAAHANLNESTILYTLFNILEHAIFLFHFFAWSHSTGWYGTLLVLVLVQFVLHIVALILRITTSSSTFEFGETLFIILELIHTMLYLWYSVAVYRHYQWLNSDDENVPSKGNKNN